MKIVTVDQMRKIEQDCATHGISTGMLMENAGRAVAEQVKRILGNIEKKRTVVLIGPGNNGGDGLVTARYLHNWGARVSLYLASTRPASDSNLESVQQLGITAIHHTQEGGLDRLNEQLKEADAVIDALFGTGKSRPLTGIFPEILNRVNQAKKDRPNLCIIAVDLPSGLNADNGAVDPACPFADYTITLGFPKPGLFKFPGAERVGKLSIVDIGMPPQLAENINLELITGDWAKAALPQRPLGANKGTFGRVLVVAGSINYIGAAYLAGTGAIRVGAGLVTLATAASLQPILASKLTEVTYIPLPESEPGIIAPEAAGILHKRLSEFDVLLAGCGLGQAEPVISFVKSLLLEKTRLPQLVLDADTLNTLSKISRWWQQIAGEAILTPHPGEMGRLAGATVSHVQSDRVALAGKLAAQWHQTLVLKGAFTVVAAPDGRCRISPFANPGLASAGTGDVLSGAIAGLLAQGLSLYDAAALGVYLHGQAGEIVRDKIGDTGMVASDLLPVLPLVIKQLKAGSKCY